MAKEILINQLFAGRYLEEGTNIGGEVINLFRDDDGNNNLFITPSGKVEEHDVEYVLFARNVSSRKIVEVIGLAEGLSRITIDKMQQIRYAGVSLKDIFSQNRYHGEADVSFSNYVTYRARDLRLPSRRIFISLDNPSLMEDAVCLNSERKVILPQSMREYYSEDLDPVAYSQLKSLIDDEDNWEQINRTEKLTPDGAYKIAPSFLEIVRKVDDENTFSNLLAYFFDYSHSGFQRFAADPSLLNIPEFGASFIVQREAMNRIDLWIESDRDIIVIENKIKSGINGVIGNDYSQINKYHEKAEEKAKEYKKKAHYYIFAPDYAKFNLKQFGLEDEYKIIKYSDIYEFFVKEAATYITDRIFPDFLRGLKRHTLSLPELRFETMRSRLLGKINQLQ